MYGKKISYGGGCSGWLARSEHRPPIAGIIVLMEAFGLTAHVCGICEKLALAGYTALAPDLYHGKIFDYGDVDGAIGAMRGLVDETAINEIDAAIDTLTFEREMKGLPIGIVGFCMGGRLAFLTACRRPSKVQAVSSFYGGSIAPLDDADRFGRSVPIKEAEHIAAPLLLIYGSQDKSIAPDEHGRISTNLSRVNKRYILSVYAGAEHGFCCEDRATFVPASASLAFSELLAFFGDTLERPTLT